MEQRASKKLERLSTLLLSRVLFRITSFKEKADTSHFKTDYNWGAIMGPLVSPKDDTGMLSTSHEALQNCSKTEILFY